MSEPEELQAQIDALRLLVTSLMCRAPAREIAEDVRVSFESWEDVHINSPVSENYLDLMRAEKNRALAMLATVQEQQEKTHVYMELPSARAS